MVAGSHRNKQEVKESKHLKTPTCGRRRIVFARGVKELLEAACGWRRADGTTCRGQQAGGLLRAALQEAGLQQAGAQMP